MIKSSSSWRFRYAFRLRRCLLGISSSLFFQHAVGQIASDDFSSSNLSGGTGGWTTNWTEGNSASTLNTSVAGGALSLNFNAASGSVVGGVTRTYDPASANQVEITFEVRLNSLHSPASDSDPGITENRFEFSSSNRSGRALVTRQAGWYIYGGPFLSRLNNGSTIANSNWIFHNGQRNGSFNNGDSGENDLVDSGIALNTTDTFRFVIQDNLVAGSYVATVQNLSTGASYTSPVLGYRRSPFSNNPSLVFAARADDAGDSAAWQINGISINASSSSPPIVAADVNNNGIPDLIELTSPLVAQFPPDEDSDGDGQSNLNEAIAGTDPFDASSAFRAANFAFTTGSANEDVSFSFTSVPGVRYAVERSLDLEPNSWVRVTPEFVATSTLSTLLYDKATLPDVVERCFFRALVLPSPDTDNDGLEDALELFIGSSIDSEASIRSASRGGDFQQFVNLMQGANSNGGLFNSTALGVPSREHAARFLNQATFGANDERIDALLAFGNNAYEKWIDNQLALPAENFASPYIDLLAERRLSDFNGNRFNMPHRVDFQSDFLVYRENLQTVWTRLALFGSDELRQRIAWGLSQIMVAGPTTVGHSRAQAEWYDTCIRNATGNFRTLLLEIALNPWMGTYLSHINNRKANSSGTQLPDENFAREIMQLFSIGLFELNQDGTRRLDSDGNPFPTYSNDDITQVARVFTGLRENRSEFGSNGRDFLSTAPMRMDESRHDTGDAVSESIYGFREKRFLQGPFYSPAPLPAFEDEPGRTGLDDIRDTIDILFNHPNTPPFICKRLIQHFITSNPSPAYVERIANVFVDNGSGVRGDLAAVVKAILLDEEARSASFMLADNSGRLKGPMLRLMIVGRALGVGASTPDINTLDGIQAWRPSLHELQEDFKQGPHTYPSVFNFYRPEYAHPGEILREGLLSPEFEILDSASAITLPNRIWSYFLGGRLHDPQSSAAAASAPTTFFEFSRFFSVADDTGALLDSLNIIYCQGRMKAETRRLIGEAIDTAHPPISSNRRDRVRLATYLTVISHDGAIIK